MDYLQEQGYLALGSRLKRLSERLAKEVGQIYKSESIEFEPRWFPIFRLISENGTSSITDIADAIGITHPAVNQIANEMETAGLIKASGDPTDKRKRLLSLSKTGEKERDKLRPIWNGLHASLSAAIAECSGDIVNAATSFEKALDKLSLLRRYEEHLEQMKKAEIEIIDLQPQYSIHFARLNRAWIEKYFVIEQSDLVQLANPEQIVADGGAVFFARFGQRIIGTCALKRKKDKSLELIKMAVDEAYRGSGTGRKLLNHSIARARELKADKIVLETNSMLKQAVALYKAFGFEEIEATTTEGSLYQRVDMYMQLKL